jgi:hypothetical protein
MRLTTTVELCLIAENRQVQGLVDGHPAVRLRTKAVTIESSLRGNLQRRRIRSNGPGIRRMSDTTIAPNGMATSRSPKRANLNRGYDGEAVVRPTMESAGLVGLHLS